MNEDMYDYMEDMLGEDSVNSEPCKSIRASLEETDSKSSIHARQLTLWSVEP